MNAFAEKMIICVLLNEKLPINEKKLSIDEKKLSIDEKKLPIIQRRSRLKPCRGLIIIAPCKGGVAPAAWGICIPSFFKCPVGAQ
jgi:hypothetical protein